MRHPRQGEKVKLNSSWSKLHGKTVTVIGSVEFHQDMHEFQARIQDCNLTCSPVLVRLDTGEELLADEGEIPWL